MIVGERQREQVITRADEGGWRGLQYRRAANRNLDRGLLPVCRNHDVRLRGASIGKTTGYDGTHGAAAGICRVCKNAARWATEAWWDRINGRRSASEILEREAHHLLCHGLLERISHTHQ